MDWFPQDVLLVLAWPIVAVALPLAILAWAAPLRRRMLALATALAGAVIGWESWRLGPMFHVWWRQEAYLERALAALANPPPKSDCGPGPIQVDPADTPPVRVAFFWYAAHGDVDGVVYDPTGLAEGKRCDWLYGARPRHMFGPWYQFSR